MKLVNIPLPQLYEHVIDGKSSTLNQFISNCVFLMKNYEGRKDLLLKNYLIKVIQSKLIRHAYLFLRVGFNSTPGQVLETFFGYKHSLKYLESLERDLLMAPPNKNEAPDHEDFEKRL